MPGWGGTPGSGQLTIDGDFTVDSAHNILVGAGANIASGQNVFAMANAPTVPVSLAGLAGGVCFVQSGDLRFISSAGSQHVLTGSAQNLSTAFQSSDITGQSSTAVASGDLIAIADISDSDALKKVTAKDIADLADGVAGTNVSTIEQVIKSADETVNNSTTLQNDDELLAALAANETVTFALVVFYNSGTTADFKFSFTVPSGATIVWNSAADGGVWNTSGTFVQAGNVVTSGTGRNIAGLGSATVHVVKGTVVNGANAGNLQYQFAQATADASDTKVLANSFLKVWRV